MIVVRLCLLIYLIPNQWRDEGLVISSPYACLMHFCMMVESFRKLYMTQNVHIVVVELYNMHTKCSTCDVACQKILQRTENIKDTSDMSKWVVSPFPTKARVCVATVKACMQAERYKRHFLKLSTFFTLMRCLLLPAPVQNRLMCANFCMKWRRRIETSLSGNLMKMVDRTMWK